MSVPDFSLLHATWGRPEKAWDAYARAMLNTFNRRVEYIFAVNSDDTPTLDVLRKFSEKRFTIVTGDFKGSSAAWDAAASASHGEILVQMQDDLELPQDWDTKLHNAVHYGTKPPDKFGCPVWWDAKGSSAFVAVSDGYRKDRLCCTAIMTRARYEQCGEFLHAGYQSVYSDDEVTYRAYRDARDGKCAMIEARDLVFLHRHHYHDKNIPLDQTYLRENSAEAYRLGAELFARRNPEAATDGLRTWG